MISDIKTSTGSENKDGDIVCILKFKVPRDSQDLDQWFWFCKHHEEFYDLMISEGVFVMAKASLALPEGQTTLDVDEEESE